MPRHGVRSLGLRLRRRHGQLDLHRRLRRRYLRASALSAPPILSGGQHTRPDAAAAPVLAAAARCPTLPTMKKKLRIDVWSDIACPWCYVGKRRLEAALAGFPARDAVDVVWRAFELDPQAPRVRDPSVSYAERLAKKYGASVAQAEAMIRRVTDVAAADGLDLRFDKARPGNTFDAHRVLHLAAKRGMQDSVKERLLRAYMTEGEAIGEPEVLARLAGQAGLDEAEVQEMLASDLYAREVRADEARARELDITGVPFFVIGGRYAVSGAQPAELLLRAIQRAWEEAMEQPDDASSEGAVCGPEGCA